MNGAEVQTLIARLRNTVEMLARYDGVLEADPNMRIAPSSITGMLTNAADALEGFQRSIVAHHNIGNLSDDVLKEWGRQGGSDCPVCREAQQ